MFGKMSRYCFFSSRILACSAGILLVNCGGTGQDEGSVSNQERNFAGLVIDGYVARTTVYLDANNNAVRDAFEPFAFTDDQGYYSFNPNTNTNYCAADASAEEAQYCLRSNITYTNVVIRVESGYDVVTGEPFLGQMSRRLSSSEEMDNIQTISPISTLLTNIRDNDESDRVLSSLDLTRNDLDIDYLNDNNINVKLANTALKIHKTVSVLSDRITDTYDEIGEELGTPQDASSAVYDSLASQIISSGNKLDDVLKNTNLIATVADAAEEKIKKIYERKELNLPQDLGTSSNPGNFQRVIDVANRLPDVVNTLIDINSTEHTNDSIKGSSRALEAIVIKAVKEKGNDETLDNAVNFVLSASQNADGKRRVNDLISSLSSDKADLNTLSQDDFTGDDFDTTEDIQSAATLPDDVKPFTQIAGKQVRVSELKFGTPPDDLEDKEVEFYFMGDPSDLKGQFVACVKYIDEANINGDLGDGNTRGELMQGFWSLLGANNGNRQSFTLLLTINYLDSEYQAIMKPAGKAVIDGVKYDKIRFDYDGDLNTWHSEAGIIDLTSLPETDQECKDRLPSRVGI